MPIRVLITKGTDCKDAVNLIQVVATDALLAYRGYDTKEIIEFVDNSGMDVVIPPKRSRKVQRKYNRNTYRFRHLTANAFLHLKHRIAARYAKNTSSFLAAVQIRCIAL